MQIKDVIDSLPLSNQLKRYYTALETLSVSIFHHKKYNFQKDPPCQAPNFHWLCRDS